MADSPSWHPLPVSHPSLPALLVSRSFAQSSYTVHLSDLAHIWVESLDRKKIIQRSLNHDTSIDASEDPKNVGAILDKLRAALDPSSPEHSRTSLTLSPSKDDADDLVLEVTCTLPGGLKPLCWPMTLKRAPAAALKSQLMLPLIQANHVYASQTDALFALLEEKDAVITRLLDKLDSTGLGLESVFTNLQGKRKVSRAAAEDRVNGLAPFSEADFRKDHSPGAGGQLDLVQLIDEAFGTRGLIYKPQYEDDDDEGKGWWTKLGSDGVRTVPLAERKKVEAGFASQPSSSTLQNAEKSTAEDDEDDFQVQATPPNAAASPRHSSPEVKAKHRNKDDEETESEPEDAPSQIPDSHPLPPENGKAKPKTGGVGRIGNKSKAPDLSPSPSPSPSPHASPDKSPQPAKPAEDEPAPDDVDNASATASETGSPPPSPEPAKGGRRKGGVGRIGRARVKLERSPSPTESDHSASPSREQQTKRKIGTIGTKAGAPAHEHEKRAARDEAGSIVEDKVETKHKETEEQRADRRRKELRANAENKVAAPPVRKKRKF